MVWLVLLAAIGCGGAVDARVDPAVPTPAPRDPDWARVPIGDVFVARGDKAALGWIELRVRGTRVCGKGKLGVEVEVANKGEVAFEWSALRPVLYDHEGRELPESWDFETCQRGSREEIAVGGSAASWLVFEKAAKGALPDVLQLSFQEPRGLGTYRVLLALRDDTKAPEVRPENAPRSIGGDLGKVVSGPIETRFYRIAVMDVRVCRAPLKKTDPIEVGLELLIENRSNVAFRLDSKPALRDAKGYRYEPEIMFVYDRPDICGDRLPYQVAAGDRVRGWVKSFEVPRDAGELAFDYSLTGEHYEPVTLRLSVGKLPAVKIAPPPAKPAEPPAPEKAPSRWIQASKLSAEVNKVSITVTDFKPCQEQLRDGGMDVGVEVLIENRAAHPIDLRWEGRIEDDKAYRHALIGTYHDQEPCLPLLDVSQPLKPGEKLRGWLNRFWLPPATRGMKLRYNFFAPRDVKEDERLRFPGDETFELIVPIGHLE